MAHGINSIVTRGYGPSASISLVVVRGYEIAEHAVVIGDLTITDTDIIHKPVDYVLPEQQTDPVRRGRARGMNLRNIFRE